MTIVGLIGVLLDVVIGTATGGDLSALPQTAIDRFAQFQENPLLGLYNLDLLILLIKLFLFRLTMRFSLLIVTHNFLMQVLHLLFFLLVQ